MIAAEKIRAAEKVLIDNGIEEDEASTVLQAIGYALLDKNLYEPHYRARNIQWDRTDDDGEHIDADLPSEVTVSFEDLQLADNATDDEIEEALAAYLTDYYGFCHNGFVFEKGIPDSNGNIVFGSTVD